MLDMETTSSKPNLPSFNNINGPRVTLQRRDCGLSASRDGSPWRNLLHGWLGLNGFHDSLHVTESERCGVGQ